MVYFTITADQARSNYIENYNVSLAKTLNNIQNRIIENSKSERRLEDLVIPFDISEEVEKILIENGFKIKANRNYVNCCFLSIYW